MSDRHAQERTPSHARSLADNDINDGDDSRYSSEILRATTYTWHPKLTLYRLLVLTATVGLGVAKAVTSYLNLDYASITLEWILGVAVFLLPRYSPIVVVIPNRLSRLVWDFLGTFGIYRPFYQFDEVNAHDSHRPKQPHHLAITGYRILITTLVSFFGMLKSAFWYGHQQRAVTTIECIFGVSLLNCSMKVYPALFHVDYTTTVLSVVHAGYTIVDIILHIVGLILSCGISFIFYCYAVTFLNMDWSAARMPGHPIVTRSTLLTLASFAMTVSVAAFYGIFVLLLLLFRLVAYSPFGKLISRHSGVRRVISLVYSIRQDYWISPILQQRRSQGFFLGRVVFRQIIKLPIRIIPLIGIIQLACTWVWLIIMYAAPPATFLEPWIPFTVTFPLLAFVLFLVSSRIYYLAQTFRAFYVGFLKFLADIWYDYIEGSSIPTN